MTWLLTIVGALMILTTVRDIFHTLWHPTGFGTLARLAFRAVWRVAKLGNRERWGSAYLAGPLGLVGTLVAWSALLVGGFALIYLPRMPQGFYFGSSLEPGASSDLVASFYLSIVAVTTLGLGDIQPATTFLRAVVPMEALLGFLLLTAGISWILQLYPALLRRRALARQLTTMARHAVADVVEKGDVSVAVQHLETVRGGLASVEMDLVQYGESYYFGESSRSLSLAAVLPQVAVLVAAGKRSSAAEVRNAAVMLEDGLSELLALLRHGFLGDCGDDEATLRAFGEDHQQSGSSSP